MRIDLHLPDFLAGLGIDGEQAPAGIAEVQHAVGIRRAAARWIAGLKFPELLACLRIDGVLFAVPRTEIDDAADDRRLARHVAAGFKNPFHFQAPDGRGRQLFFIRIVMRAGKVAPVQRPIRCRLAVSGVLSFRRFIRGQARRLCRRQRSRYQ